MRRTKARQVRSWPLIQMPSEMLNPCFIGLWHGEDMKAVLQCCPHELEFKFDFLVLVVGV